MKMHRKTVHFIFEAENMPRSVVDVLANIFNAGYDPHKDLCNYLINQSSRSATKKASN